MISPGREQAKDADGIISTFSDDNICQGARPGSKFMGCWRPQAQPAQLWGGLFSRELKFLIVYKTWITISICKLPAFVCGGVPAIWMAVL